MSADHASRSKANFFGATFFGGFLAHAIPSRPLLWAPAALSSKMNFWTLFLGFAVATVLYLSFQRLKQLYRLFREYYVLWNVAIGARSDRRAMSTKLRLHTYVCKTKLLDEVSVNEIFLFLMSMIDSGVTVEDFHKVLLSYSHVFLWRERTDGSLRGTALIAVDSQEQDGEKFTLIRFGLTFFQRNYQGGPMLYYVVLYHILKELVLHPRTPVYLIGKAFSYKSYLVCTKAIKSLYPRFDAKTPAFEQKIIDNFAAKMAMKGDVYYPERCVIERNLASIKEFVAPLTSQELQNPHVKFFQETNPGWDKGHQLVMLGRFTWKNMFETLYKAVTRTKRARHEGITSTDKAKMPPLQRRLSFQSEEARSYVRKHSNSLMATNANGTEKNDNIRKQRPGYFTQFSFEVGISF